MLTCGGMTNVTRDEGLRLARLVQIGLTAGMRGRLKSIHVMPHLHSGHLTVRVFMHPKTAEDPEAMIFARAEL